MVAMEWVGICEENNITNVSNEVSAWVHGNEGREQSNYFRTMELNPRVIVLSQTLMCSWHGALTINILNSEQLLPKQ